MSHNVLYTTKVNLHDYCGLLLLFNHRQEQQQSMSSGFQHMFSFLRQVEIAYASSNVIAQLSNVSAVASKAYVRAMFERQT